MGKTIQLALPYLKGLAYYGTLGFFTYLMVLITAQYIPLRLDVAFLRIKEAEIARPYYQVAFFSHVYTSVFVLFFGIFQFSSWIRTQFPKFHRRSGMIYVVLILVFASPSGLIMGIHANGGLIAQVSFILQALLWFIFTYQALRFAKTNDWSKHEAFMLRSYALTLSAISLRLFKWIIVHTLEPPPMDTYRIVSWLGWTVNLALVEWYIYHRRSVSKRNTLP
ncbi:MAG: DUF2306 domain-containing protein [Bacteroidota bacterium]